MYMYDDADDIEAEPRDDETDDEQLVHMVRHILLDDDDEQVI